MGIGLYVPDLAFSDARPDATMPPSESDILRDARFDGRTLRFGRRNHGASGQIIPLDLPEDRAEGASVKGGPVEGSSAADR